MKHIHILGIAGTFMAGLALLARELGYVVTGSDAQIYPPMSTQLEAAGITLDEGYEVDILPHPIDCFVIGNVMRRGHPVIEWILNQGLPYQSGPAFLAQSCLQHRWVLAVAGTHGKTTTSSLLAWILEYAGLSPGFLIGGMPGNFSVSARAGQGKHFVIEADEYDTAFFDKRSKFIHYQPRTLILNNLEFDHADIFDSLEDIKKQCHQLIRTIPSEGLIITPKKDAAIADVLFRGVWTPVAYLGEAWRAESAGPDDGRWSVYHEADCLGEVHWDIYGAHQRANALAAIVAASHVGVSVKTAVAALKTFILPKRRMEIKAVIQGVTVYDDFAHHPTAIAMTLAGLKEQINGAGRIIAIVELASNTMKMGVHAQTLGESLALADYALIAAPLGSLLIEEGHSKNRVSLCASNEDILQKLKPYLRSGDHLLVMTNKTFDGLHEQLLRLLDDLDLAQR